jgi:hypothetical protein
MRMCINLIDRMIIRSADGPAPITAEMAFKGFLCKAVFLLHFTTFLAREILIVVVLSGIFFIGQHVEIHKI